MKSIVLSSLLLLPVAGFAASNSAINDLQYVPDAGTVYGSTNYSYLSYSDREFNGTSEDHYTTTGSLFQQTIGWGMTNNLFLSADLLYGTTKSETNGRNSTKSDGLGDIVLNGRFRASEAGGRFDILGKLSISPGDAEVEDDGDSNGYSGGHALALGAEYGMKKESVQWSVSALVTRFFEATTEDKGSDEKIKDDAHNGLNLGANLLTQIHENCYIKNFVGVEFTEEFDDDQDGTSYGSTNYSAGAEFQHLFSKDFMAKAGLSTVMGGNGINYVVLLYNLGVNYQF